MYGIIKVIIEDLVIQKFGREAWNAVKHEAGCAEVPNDGFIRHEHYKDDIVWRLVLAASHVSGLTVATIWDAFGDHFVHWMMDHGYGSLLKSQGTTLLDFLNSLNDMHNGLQYGMPKLVPPRFTCSLSNDCLALEYTSHRGGLEAMVPGMIRAAGECLFNKRYTCTTIRHWTSDDMSHVLFKVDLEGEHEATFTSKRNMMQRIAKRAINAFILDDHDSYAFFEQNPSMCSGWVNTLQTKVRAIKTVVDAKAFAETFDLRHLASLLTTASPAGAVALSTLFMEPLPHPDGLVPVPSLGYTSGRGGVAGIRTAMVGSVAMCADVTSGCSAVVQTTKHSRFSFLMPVRVMVCAMPSPLAEGILLRALADTQNDTLLESVEVWGLVAAAWTRVYPRFALNVAVDTAVVVLISCVLHNVHLGMGCRETLIMKCVFLKEVLEQCIVVSGHLRRGWVMRYASGYHLFQLISLFLYANFLSLSDSNGCVNAIQNGGVPGAVFAFSRWLQLLYHLRVLPGFGPMILPIVYTWRSVMPFCVVVIIVFLGFVYSCAILEQQELGLDTFDSVLRMLFNIPEEGDLPLDKPGMHLWHCVFSSVVVLWLLNLLIGVLGDSYRAYRDTTSSNFNRERLRTILDLELCLWPRKQFCRYLYWLQALFCIEEEAPRKIARDHQEQMKYLPLTQEPETDAYLWLCIPEGPSRPPAGSLSFNDQASADLVACKGPAQDLCGCVQHQTERLHQRLLDPEDHNGTYRRGRTSL